MTASQEILTAINQAHGSASSKAGLAAIAEGEGGKTFNILFGGGMWAGSMAAFPPWPGVTLSRGSATHAAGAFQFEPATYADISKVSGRTAFGPQDQIQNAWDLANQAFAAKTSVISLHGALETAGNNLLLIPMSLIKIWPGGCDSGFPRRFVNNLPLVMGGSIGEPTNRAVLTWGANSVSRRAGQAQWACG
jgi:hypothetical protein